MALNKKDLGMIAEIVTTAIQKNNEVLRAEIKKSAKDTTTSIMAYIENGVEKDVKILAESIDGINNRLDKVEKRLSHLENQNIDIMGAVIKDHSVELLDHEKRIESNTDDIKILKLK